MTKGKTPKVITAAISHQPLKQARLIGLNDNLKSVREKSSTSHKNELKQTGLASFGFGSVPQNTTEKTKGDLLKNSPRKRRKRLSPGAEVPETQFAQNTQSPEFNYHDAFADGEVGYSSPLSSPPEEGKSQVSVSSIIVMPPPLVPVTPKRRKILEVPDSKSPPTTPLTPYQSQQERGGLSNQTSPTTRLSKSPMTLQAEQVDIEDEYHSQTLKRAGRSLFALSQKRSRQKKHGKKKSQEAKETPESDVPTGIEEVERRVPTGSKDRTINSSQWWDLEDTQDVSLPTQPIQNSQVHNTKIFSQTQGSIPTFGSPGPQKPTIGLIRVQEPFYINPSYKSDPPIEDPGTSGLQNLPFVDDGDVQEPLHRMACLVPPEFHNDTPELEDEEHLIPPMHEGKTRSILNTEGTLAPLVDEDIASEDLKHEDGLEEVPQYDAYRTQQFPSSFWQHGGTYQHESPEILMSSQWVPVVLRGDSVGSDEKEPSQGVAPDIANELNPTSREDGQEPSQLVAPGIVNVPGSADIEDKQESSQFLPGKPNPITYDTKNVCLEEAESLQSLSEIIIPTTPLLAMGDENSIEDIPPSQTLPGPESDVVDDEQAKIEFNDDDDDFCGSRAITRSQLLPSELMETFPMPPPLSQYSSYGYSDLNIESETQ